MGEGEFEPNMMNAFSLEQIPIIDSVFSTSQADFISRGLNLHLLDKLGEGECIYSGLAFSTWNLINAQN